MKIPEDVYVTVFELTTRLVEAREESDTKSFWSAYNEHHAYCETNSASHGGHLFLLETLADFTDDDESAATLYFRALDQEIGPDASVSAILNWRIRVL
jgi:hypothetical protein